MLTEIETVQDSLDTVLVETCRLIRAVGQIVIRVFIRLYLTALYEADGIIQYAGVPGGEDIATRSKGQPEVIVRTVSPDTSTRWGVPPMLNIFLQGIDGTRKGAGVRARG